MGAFGVVFGWLGGFWRFGARGEGKLLFVGECKAGLLEGEEALGAPQPVGGRLRRVHFWNWGSAFVPGLPGVVGDVVFGAEVEDVLFVYVVIFVGVEGVYANSFDGWEVVDFDAFAGEWVVAEVD